MIQRDLGDGTYASWDEDDSCSECACTGWHRSWCSQNPDAPITDDE